MAGHAIRPTKLNGLALQCLAICRGGNLTLQALINKTNATDLLAYYLSSNPLPAG